MNHFIQKQEKYAFIIPKKDIQRLNESDLEVLEYIIRKIDVFRKSDGQPPLSSNKYIVCNQDEPYADEVWDIILEGERKKLIQNEDSKRNYINYELELILRKYPCPFCNCDEIFLEGGFTHMPTNPNSKANRYFAICTNCGLSTEWVPYPVKAVELWCTRNGKKPDMKALLKNIEMK
jgi:transcription elongation factor Elf1